MTYTLKELPGQAQELVRLVKQKQSDEKGAVALIAMMIDAIGKAETHDVEVCLNMAYTELNDGSWRSIVDLAKRLEATAKARERRITWLSDELRAHGGHPNDFTAEDKERRTKMEKALWNSHWREDKLQAQVFELERTLDQTKEVSE